MWYACSRVVVSNPGGNCVLREGTGPRFASTQERINENIYILFPPVEIEPTTCRINSLRHVPLRYDWPLVCY